jgi:ubiquinone biosynthesis monooxygenase Coq7
MAEQEKRHLAAFDKLVASRRVRPTLLSPLWDVAGFALGAVSALLGERAAMACTVAVEEVIDEHYRRQSEALAPAPEETGAPEKEPDLRRTIDEFRADECHHRDIALAHGAREMLGYSLFSGVIKTGSRLAIWLSTRI